MDIYIEADRKKSKQVRVYGADTNGWPIGQSKSVEYSIQFAGNVVDA